MPKAEKPPPVTQAKPKPKPETASKKPSNKPAVEEFETAYLSILGMAGSEDAEKVAKALKRIRGVKSVEVSPETGEAVVVSRKGGLVLEILPKAVQESGPFEASLQPREVWHLSLAAGTEFADAQKIRTVLLSLPGVSFVEVGEEEVEVAAYVPKVTTPRILEALRPTGCTVSVQEEAVRLRLNGTLDEEALKAVLARLERVDGVGAVAVAEPPSGEGSGVLELKRERGRAALERLNRALEGTGCSLAATG